MKDKVEIGITTMKYTEEGVIKSVHFSPTMKIEIKNKDLKEFIKSGESQNLDTIQRQSELVMASWFSKMNEIELADREKYEIVSEVVNCEKWENGNIKQCEIKYIFQKLDVVS